MKSLFPRFGLPDFTGVVAMAAASSAVLMVRAYSCPAFLHPSAGCHYTATSLGFKMPSKASKLRNPLTLDILLYYLCLWPQLSPLASESPVFLSESPVCVSEMLLQISPWPRRAHQTWELPPPLLSVPCSCWRRCWLRALGGSAKGVIFLVDYLLALLTINCTSAGHMFHRVVCKADNPGEMLSTANGAWNTCFCFPQWQVVHRGVRNS